MIPAYTVPVEQLDAEMVAENRHLLCQKQAMTIAFGCDLEVFLVVLTGAALAFLSPLTTKSLLAQGRRNSTSKPARVFRTVHKPGIDRGEGTVAAAGSNLPRTTLHAGTR
jgi:hypothetical protein